MSSIPAFLIDPYFWVQVAVAIGTLALAGVAFWNDKVRRNATEAERYGGAIEEFLAPAMEQVSRIQGLAQPQSDPMRPGLAEAAHALEQLLLHSRHAAYKVSETTVSRLRATSVMAWAIVGGLKRLKSRESAILDDVGSDLSGEYGRKEHPKLTVYQGGRPLIGLDGAQLLELWLKRLRFQDLLMFWSDEFAPGDPIEVKVHHGKNKVRGGPDIEPLQQLLFDRLKSEDAAITRLPKQLDQLRIESDSARRVVSSTIAKYAEKAAS